MVIPRIFSVRVIDKQEPRPTYLSLGYSLEKDPDTTTAVNKGSDHDWWIFEIS